MADKNRMRIYRIEDCVVFKKTKERFGGLSNMAPGFPLVVNGVQIRTSEALYQACRYPHMPEVQRLIINERSPMTAKMRSRPYRKKSRPDWDKIRVSIMRWCLRAKLAQNWTKFSDLLLQSGKRPIVEESKRDDFWGAKPTEDGELIGQNVLGRLLMELREELHGPEIESLKNVVPPKISNFTLFNEQIQSLGNMDKIVVADNVQIALPSDSFSANPSDKNIKINNMIPKECKRLAEVDFPIAVVSKHSAREKSIRFGHPSTLHLWWARRPLGACRAMLMALLLPDPCDPACPEDFKDKARGILLNKHGRPSRWKQQIGNLLGLRKTLLEFIGDFSKWDNATNMDYLSSARALIKAAHPEETPLVVDPFAGGGSIPLEALRLGCETFASDLNPVACLILKVMLENIPRHGSDLVEELRRIGEKIKKQIEKELIEFYPKDPDGSSPIAYLWARTVKCESPNCGAEIPLMRSFWLSKKMSHKRALRFRIHRNMESTKVEFELFEPMSDKEVHGGTVTRAKATCLCCETVLPPDRVRAQLAEQRGGADVIFDDSGNRLGGARLLAVVTLHPEVQGRNFRLPTDRDYNIVWRAHKHIKENFDSKMDKTVNSFPNESTPWRGGHRSVVSLRVYGMNEWGDLFTARQKLGIASIIRIIQNNNAMKPEVWEFLGLALSRFTDICNACCRWESTKTQVRNLFTRHDLPIMWDFAEASLLAEQAGDYSTTLNTMIRVVEKLQDIKLPGQVNRSDARNSALPSDCASVWFTDPPYYDAVAYADLSDFFYVWLKRSIVGHPMLSSGDGIANGLSPKNGELTVTTKATQESLPKTRAYFESGMGEVFAEGCRVLKHDGVASVVFAHKTTEGWESLLTGMISGGWTITGSWPISTELSTRVNARENASLATSVHLICRPRREEAPIGDWADVLKELPTRVGDWMERLQGEGVRGADLVFACIGPALEIFSRYAKVEVADGREVKLAEYLEKVWEVVGRMALEQILGTEEARARNGMAGVLEEDARLTALFLWTLQATNGQYDTEINDRSDGQLEEDVSDDDEGEVPKGKTKGYSLVFDVVRRFAQPLGIELPKWEARVIVTKKGIVRLMAVSERAKQLFGADGVETATDWIEENPGKPVQLGLFPESTQSAGFKIKGHKRSTVKGNIPTELSTQVGATTLDRVHAAMLLQASGQANALRMLIKSEQDRSPDFLRLANALSALYPKGSEEKRLLDAMLLAVPR